MRKEYFYQKNEIDIEKNTYKENKDLNNEKIVNFSSKRKSSIFQNLNNYEIKDESSDHLNKELDILNKEEFLFFEQLNEIFTNFSKEINKKKNIEMNKIKNKILSLRSLSLENENINIIKNIKHNLKNFNFTKFENDLKNQIQKIRIEINIKERKIQSNFKNQKSKFNKVNRSLLSNFEDTNSHKKNQFSNNKIKFSKKNFQNSKKKIL